MNTSIWTHLILTAQLLLFQRTNLKNMKKIFILYSIIKTAHILPKLQEFYLAWMVFLRVVPIQSLSVRFLHLLTAVWYTPLPEKLSVVYIMAWQFKSINGFNSTILYLIYGQVQEKKNLVKSSLNHSKVNQIWKIITLFHWFGFKRKFVWCQINRAKSNFDPNLVQFNQIRTFFLCMQKKIEAEV